MNFKRLVITLGRSAQDWIERLERRRSIKEENIKLREYIAGIRRENPTLISPNAVDHGLHSHYEATRDTLSEVEKLIESARKQEDDFLTRFVQAYDKIRGLMFRIQYLEGVWEEFRPIQKRTNSTPQSFEEDSQVQIDQGEYCAHWRQIQFPWLSTLR